MNTGIAAFAVFALQGCVATTIVGVAAETVEAGVELTGAAVGGAVDIVTPDGKSKKERKALEKERKKMEKERKRLEKERRKRD